MSRKDNTKKKKTAGDYILTLVLIAAICVFCYAAFNLYHIYTEYKKGTDEYNSISEMAVTERDPDEVEEMKQPDEQPTAPISIDFSSLKSINDDVIGWIYMEALPQISYPVVQGKDNSTYLHQTYEKNYNFAGTIFIDYENKRDFSDCNTLVYGHNMKNGSMFGMLKKYRADETLYNTSKYFWILTPDKDYRYEIIAAYTTSVNSDTYTLFKGPGKEFLEYEKKMLKNSEIKTDATEEQADKKDKIVTLSTCTGNQATRFVVQGKRVNVVDPQYVCWCTGDSPVQDEISSGTDGMDGRKKDMGNEIEKLQKIIDESDNIVFFGGAGVSTESGIPDFRSQDGLYNQKYDYPPETILSHTFFMRRPEEFFKFYQDKMLCDTAKPNAAHLKLAELEKNGKLKAVISQNIDNLHQMAGSRYVLEHHGSVYLNFCMK